MAALFFVCPATGHEVSTGLDIDPASFASLGEIFTEISCPHCSEPHRLTSVKTWFEEIADDEVERA
jgi:hypothetical protein